MRYNPKGEDHRPTIEEYLEATGHQEEYESYKMSTYAWNPLEEGKKLRITKSSLGTFGWCHNNITLRSSRVCVASKDTTTIED